MTPDNETRTPSSSRAQDPQDILTRKRQILLASLPTSHDLLQRVVDPDGDLLPIQPVLRARVGGRTRRGGRRDPDDPKLVLSKKQVTKMLTDEPEVAEDWNRSRKKMTERCQEYGLRVTYPLEYISNASAAIPKKRTPSFGKSRVSSLPTVEEVRAVILPCGIRSKDLFERLNFNLEEEEPGTRTTEVMRLLRSAVRTVEGSGLLFCRDDSPDEHEEHAVVGELGRGVTTDTSEKQRPVDKCAAGFTNPRDIYKDAAAQEERGGEAVNKRKTYEEDESPAKRRLIGKSAQRVADDAPLAARKDDGEV